MAERTVDRFEPGETLEPMELVVTPEMHQRYLEALQAEAPRYAASAPGGPWVHPALLLNQSNPTRSKSHLLEPGTANVHAKEQVTFHRPGRVGGRFRFTWKVLERFEKRGRPYMVFECLVLDEKGTPILTRRMTSVFVRGSA